MTEKRPYPVEAAYDDITANLLHADERYVLTRPTFEEFAAFYELLVNNFYRNVGYANMPLATTKEQMLGVPMSTLRAQWEQSIWTWYDVEDFLDDWMIERLSETDAQ